METIIVDDIGKPHKLSKPERRRLRGLTHEICTLIRTAGGKIGVAKFKKRPCSILKLLKDAP